MIKNDKERAFSVKQAKMLRDGAKLQRETGKKPASMPQKFWDGCITSQESLAHKVEREIEDYDANNTSTQR